MEKVAQNKQNRVIPDANFSSVKAYEFEWREISRYLLTDTLKELKSISIKGNLKTSKFRSICWSLFFGHLNNGDYKDWVGERTKQRKYYSQLKDRFFQSPYKLEDKNDDPLSQSENSLWNQHFCDQELCAVIRQDVVRTFPGIEFFRKSNIQDVMTSILFCYARENPIMCYRQGMHEILAPIVFVIHCDHQAFQHFQTLNDNFDPILPELLDPTYLEDDSYWMFAHIMAKIETYYRINDVIPTATGYFPSSPCSALTPESDHSGEFGNRHEIEVVDQLNVIRDEILAKEDPKLLDHLQQLDIPLSIFGIRWLRLLFGREFPLQDLLVLWDAIFADGSDFALTNYVVVSMLITIRDKLISTDYTSCLTLLMKYPNTMDISNIIHLALYMKTPRNLSELGIGGRRVNSDTSQKFSTIPKNFQSKATTSASVPLPKNKIATSAAIKKTKTTDNQHEKTENIAMKVNGIHTVTARAAIKVAAQNNYIGEHNQGIVDGYFENDPEVTTLTLQHAQTIMAISRYKLIQYLGMLRQNIPQNSNDTVHQSLDGIEEICSLLKNSYSSSLYPNTISVPVEPALEADEIQSQKKLNVLSKPDSLELDIVRKNSPATSGVGDDTTSARTSSVQHKTDSYEIPDNSRIAERLFGNVRDIPMRTFKTGEPLEEMKNLPSPDPTK